MNQRDVINPFSLEEYASIIIHTLFYYLKCEVLLEFIVFHIK
jgi:hypothetical protein